MKYDMLVTICILNLVHMGSTVQISFKVPGKTKNNLSSSKDHKTDKHGTEYPFFNMCSNFITQTLREKLMIGTEP